MSEIPKVKVAMDNGYGQVKASSDQGQEMVTPACAAKLSSGALQLNQLEGYFEDMWTGGWLVGNDAMTHAEPESAPIDSNWFTHPQFRVLSLWTLKQLGAKKVELYTGLPVSHYQEQRERLTQTILGWQRAGFEITVPMVLPQPVGTYFNEALDEQGNQKDGFSGRVGIVDIGHGTLDLIEINNYEVSWTQHRSVPQGVSRAQEALLAELNVKKGCEMSPQDAMNTLRTGIYKHKGQEKSAEKMVRDQKKQLVWFVTQQMKKLWGSMNSLDTIIFTGGGAALLNEELTKAFSSHKTVVPSDPDMANCRGYMKWALFLQES
jgi:hypothetical protein